MFIKVKDNNNFEVYVNLDSVESVRIHREVTDGEPEAVVRLRGVEGYLAFQGDKDSLRRIMERITLSTPSPDLDE